MALLERYLVWLYADNAGHTSIHDYYLPTAGHVLGYHLEHHKTLDLQTSFERVMAYFKAKQICERWQIMGRHALARFRRFMQEERGYARLPQTMRENRLEKYQEGLPDWLVVQLSQHQQIRQQNWRRSRLQDAIVNFWSSHSRLWRWLFAEYDIQEIGDIKRSYIHSYIDHRLALKMSVGSVNLELRAFQGTLRFLQERDFEVPQSLLRLPGLRAADELQRYLTDEQVRRLQAEFERCVQVEDTPARRRNALLNRAVFYLLWQAGLRTSEIEDLLLLELDLPHKQLTIREGKGKKDRTVYLTARTCVVIQEYLEVRGSSHTDHIFLYRHEPLGKDLVRNRIKAAGRRAGVKVTPHQLRHTFATQLVNTGCRITTIQALMGHKRLSTTLVYAEVHNHTVAEDYYTAMAKVEQSLEGYLRKPQAEKPAENGHDSGANGNAAHLLSLVTALQVELLPESQQVLVMELKRGLKAMAKPPDKAPRRQVVNEQKSYPQEIGYPP